mgnify:CR=1 FL=1
MAYIAEAETESLTGESGAEAGILASLGLNGYQFAAQLLNFVLVIAIVWWLILRPLVRTLEARRKMIDESLEKAKQVVTALSMSEVKFQERIDEAKVEANKLIERAHDSATTAAVSMKQKAHKEIEMLVNQAKKNINIDRERMQTELRDETVALVIATMEKMLEKKYSDTDDKKMVAEVLKELSSR